MCIYSDLRIYIAGISGRNYEVGLAEVISAVLVAYKRELPFRRG